MHNVCLRIRVDIKNRRSVIDLVLRLGRKGPRNERETGEEGLVGVHDVPVGICVQTVIADRNLVRVSVRCPVLLSFYLKRVNVKWRVLRH